MRPKTAQAVQAWMAAAEPFCGVSRQAVKYIVHLPEDKWVGYQALHNGIALTAEIDNYQLLADHLSVEERHDQIEQISRKIADYIADRFIVFTLQIKVIKPVSRDNVDIHNLYLAALCLLSEKYCVPILECLNSIIVGLANQFGNAASEDRLETMTLGELREKLFSDLRGVILTKPYNASEVKPTQLVSFLENNVLIQADSQAIDVSQVLLKALRLCETIA